MADMIKVKTVLTRLHDKAMEQKAATTIFGIPRDCVIQATQDALDLLKEQERKDKMFHALEDDWKRLKEQNAVVRCKDCKHCDTDTLEHCWCMILARSREPDWFCADGERKET